MLRSSISRTVHLSQTMRTGVLRITRPTRCCTTIQRSRQETSSVASMFKKYGWNFVAVYYAIHIPSIFGFAAAANYGLVTDENIKWMLEKAVGDFEEEITEENKYKILAKHAGVVKLGIDVERLHIPTWAGSLLVGYILSNLAEPLRLPLAIAVTARIAA